MQLYTVSVFVSDILRRFLLSFLRQVMPALKGRIQLMITKCGVRGKVSFAALLSGRTHVWGHIYSCLQQEVVVRFFTKYGL